MAPWGRVLLGIVGTAIVLLGAPAGALALHWSAPARITVAPPSGAQGDLSQIGLQSVSCAGSSLCVAVGSGGEYVSTAPAAGAGSWKPIYATYQDFGGPPITTCVPSSVPGAPPVCTTTQPPQPPAISNVFPDAVSCPTPNLCVIVGSGGASGGSAYVSTTPAGPASSWSGSALRVSDPTFVTCSATLVCLTGGFTNRGGTRLLRTTRPAVRGTWHLVDTFPYAPSTSASSLSASCASVMCALGVTGDQSNQIASSENYVLTSTQPGSTVAGWNADQVQEFSQVEGVACSGPHLCVAIMGTYYASGASIFATTRPTNPSAHWHTVATFGAVRFTTKGPSNSDTPTGASCAPDGRLCAVSFGYGTVLTSTSPSRRGTWHRAQIDHAPSGASRQQTQFAIACPTSSLCVAVDGAGRVITGTP